MAQFTDRILKTLSPPESGNRIHYDHQVKGLGLRITAAGNKSFIFNYRTHGRERRLTIGLYGDSKSGKWTVTRARKRAGKLRGMIDNDVDPLGEAQGKRAAPTVADLCQRFEDEHLPKLRAKTATEYRALIHTYVLPSMRHAKVVHVTFSDVDGLHRKITKAGAPYRANRVVALISKMFSLAQKWDWCERNPAKGIERNAEEKRHRYLSPDELARLSKALAEHEDAQASDIIRLLLLTGARRGEVQAMRWTQLDLDAGVWTKASSETKQARLHRVPLSDAACQLLRDLRASAPADAEYVFPGRHGGHRIAMTKNWAEVCKAANITDVRLHDMRHTFGSVLASAGLSLPIIGALLGHSQPQTTARYAHLFDSPLRQASERAAAIVTGKPSAEIVELDKNKRA